MKIAEIEAVQNSIFKRLQDDLSEADSHDYYLTGKDIAQYTQALRNLEDLKRTAEAE